MATRRSLVAAVCALASAAALSACGEDDFENQPRPAAPIEVTALVTDREVKVSPSAEGRVGAGLAMLTISNQSENPAEFTLRGPSNEASDPIPPGGVGSMKVELEEGDYTASAGPESDAREATLAVGAPRKSSQNELLLP